MADPAGEVLLIGGSPELVSLLGTRLSRSLPESSSIRSLPLGDEALEALRTRPVGLAFLIEGDSRDRMFDLLSRVAHDRGATPVVVVTREEAPDLFRAAREAGALDALALETMRESDLERVLRYAGDWREWRRSETRLRALVDVAREVLSVIDPEGAVLYTSPSIEGVLGYPPDERLGMNAASEVHPDDRPRVLEELRRVSEDPSHRAHARYRMKHADGSWRVHDVVAENHLTDPHIAGIAVSAWDVTEQVEREEWVRYQATLLNAVGQSVVATDVSGTVEFWNRAAEELYGWSADEAIGRPIMDLVVPADSTDRAARVMAGLQVSGTWSGELELRSKDGSQFLAFVTNSPVLDANGELIGIIGVSTDITAGKRTESALQERVKELRTLYQVSRLMNRVDAPLRERLSRVVETMTDGWLHPDVTVARLVLGELEFSCEGFRETPWMQSSPIAPSEGPAGRLEVALLEERPERDDGPFLREEAALLDGLAQTIGEAVARDRLTGLLERIIASLEEAVIVLEEDGDGSRVRDVNPAAERIFGWSREELVHGGLKLRQLFGDPQVFLRYRTMSLPELERGGVFHGTVPMRRKDGSTFEAEQTVTLLDPTRGVSGGRVMTVRDISVRRRAEERFGVLSREIVDHIYVIGRDMSVQYSTPSVESITGLTREEFESLGGEELMQIVHPEDRDRVRETILQLAEEPGAVHTGQYRILTASGEVRHVEALVRNLFHNPVIDGLVVTTRDVTDRVKLEQRLRQGQKMEAVGRLAGGIAHDFNNILTVIRSQSDLLLLEPPEPEALETELKVIQTSVERAATLTGQLLAFSRDQILRPRTVALGDVVRSMGQLVDRIIGEDITLRYDISDELPPIEVDPGQLEQAVMNLAVNARDAMPEGGTLSLSAYREETIRSSDSEEDAQDPQPRRVVCTVLRVSDSGAGMDEETRARIFEPFFTTKAKGKGTGLGLAMVYGFVEQSGGSIRVESRPGEGTSFYLSFPAASGVPTDVRTTRPTSVQKLEPTPAARVLLVEDDPAVQRATARILGGTGMEVVPVGDAESGLALIRQGETFDMMLTDLVLPGMNGRELVALLRESNPELPVLVMSGYAEGPSGQELNLPDGVRFIQKPFTRHDLMSEVRATLDRE